ncbi:MAG: transporter [Clostridia bacterium]|jgi:ABC-type sugar transport system ATPase subunit|nr:transporter [Clostridia bacterium]
MSKTVLELKNISKSFFGIAALKNVEFSVKEGQVISLIGENGAGKSTLMNIIGGVLKPDGGEMKLQDQNYIPNTPKDAAEAGIEFIHQELNLFPNLSIADNMFITKFPKVSQTPIIDKANIRNHTKEMLQAVDLKVSPDTLVENLSPGERQLVEIAKAISSDPQILIFDEPTTSLTAKETERLFELINSLRTRGKAIIYISHILADVMNISDEIVVLRDGQVTDKGLKKDFTIDRMICSMVGRDIKQLYPERKSQPTDEIALKLENVSQPGTVHNISFELNKGEVLGIFGLMGSGRSELARIIFGLDPHETGKISIDGDKVCGISPKNSIENKLAFVTENRREEGLLMDVSIAENMGLVTLTKYASKLTKVIKKTSLYDQVKKVGELLKLKSGDIEKYPPKSLSGGNQQKVVIGKWLMTSPKVLIVDEPTRGIDVGAKYEVYSIINDLAAQGTGVLMISSELEELMGTCDRILVMNKGEIISEFSKTGFTQKNIMRAAFRQDAV